MGNGGLVRRNQTSCCFLPDYVGTEVSHGEIQGHLPCRSGWARRFLQQAPRGKSTYFFRCSILYILCTLIRIPWVSSRPICARFNVSGRIVAPCAVDECIHQIHERNVCRKRSYKMYARNFCTCTNKGNARRKCKLGSGPTETNSKNRRIYAKTKIWCALSYYNALFNPYMGHSTNRPHLLSFALNSAQFMNSTASILELDRIAASRMWPTLSRPRRYISQSNEILNKEASI